MKIDHMGYLMNHLDQPVVVIVGGGPVGLATAIELGTRKIHCILLERNIRDSWSPRAKTTHTRTRGFMRRWGVAKDLAKRSEEHTSELQSLMRSSYAVFCLKKKKHQQLKKTATISNTPKHNHIKHTT